MTLAGLRDLNFLNSFTTLVPNEVCKKELRWETYNFAKTNQTSRFDHKKAEIWKKAIFLGSKKGLISMPEGGRVLFWCFTVGTYPSLFGVKVFVNNRVLYLGYVWVDVAFCCKRVENKGMNIIMVRLIGLIVTIIVGTRTATRTIGHTGTILNVRLFWNQLENIK